MKHRRVLFINQAAVMGGAEHCLIDIAMTYSQSSKVLLLSNGPLYEYLESAGVRVEVLPTSSIILDVRASSGLRSLRTIPELWKLAGKIADIARDFEVVHANSQKAFIIAALARLRGSPPLVWHLRNILTANNFSFFNRRLAVTLANFFSAKIIAISQSAAIEFVKIGGNKNLLKVIYDGLSTSPFEKITPKQTEDIRKYLEIDNHIVLIGVFSRVSFLKGQHVLVEAIQQLPSHIHALIVGDALFGEDEYLAKLKAMIINPAIAHRIHWLGFRNDVPLLMSACDIIVHTSTEPEPSARVAIEGQLAQKTVIASAAGGIFEIIEDGKTGRLFPPGDADALAKIINEVLNEPIQAKEIAKQGKKNAQAKFSLDHSLKEIDQVFEDVVN